MKTFAIIPVLILSSLAPVLSVAAGGGNQVAAPWSSAAAQTGLTQARETDLPATLRTEFSKVDDDLKLWVYFADKAVFEEAAYLAAIDDVAASYNARATQRRRLRRTVSGLFDGHDLPVPRSHIEAVTGTGARIVTTSRWLNAVSVRADRVQAERIAGLACVRAVRRVQVSKRADLSTYREMLSNSSAPGGGDREFYGHAQVQLEQINLPALHALGYTGEGVMIGVLDSGFRRDHAAYNYPGHPLTVVAEWDFMNGDPNTGIEAGDDPDQHFHGTVILASVAAYAPMEMVGAAYDASYVLAKVEDAASEYPLEEDWFAAGLEFVEAEGCDVATSSLIAYWYGQGAMNGETSVMAQAFNVATANGMHCCQAVGNEGHDNDPTTSHLTTPGDAFDVISCGAVDVNNNIAGFSSDGPTLDGRVKPEVLARGSGAWTVSAYDQASYGTVSGTSISAPQVAGAVACLVQAHPDWTVDTMRNSLFNTSDYYLAHGGHDPLYVLGFGIIDAALAESSVGGIAAGVGEIGLHTIPRAHPNPFRERTLIKFDLPVSGMLRLEVYDVGGRWFRLVDHGFRGRGSHGLIVDSNGLPSGVYPYRLLLDDRPVGGGKLTVLR